MHTRPRTESILLDVIHVNVGPENVNGAAQLESYLKSISAGYHNVHDDRHTLTTAADNLVVDGAPFVNGYAKHHCIIGQASQSVAEWDDAYSKGELTLCAKAVASDCDKYGLAPRRLSVPEVHSRVKGICGHIDVTNAFKADGLRLHPPIILDHWDPGPYFPWNNFIRLVNFYKVYKPQPVLQVEEEMIAETGIIDPKTQRERFAEVYAQEKSLLLHNGLRLQGDTGPTPMGTWVSFKEAQGRVVGARYNKQFNEVRVYFSDSGVFKYPVVN